MRIYFMSIGGTGMGNAAILMRQLGHEVTGADQALYPPMSDALAAAGIQPLEGYDAKRLAELAPDLVVVGNVNTRGNPEVEWLLENRHVRMTSLPALLHDYLLRDRRNVVVCGTHGKTTTSTLCAHLLEGAGCEPGFFIGGVPSGRTGGVAPGVTGGPFVIEGDEYDSAFFDKRSKFIHYAPNILLLNNLEFDHADIFRDVTDIQRTFQHVTRIVPGSGAVVANGDDPQLAPLLNVAWTSVWRVGVGEHNDLRIEDFHENAEGSRFTLSWQGREWAKVEWGQWGVFNARNAAIAALGAALAAGHADPTAFPLQSLRDFAGVRRRQEVLFDNGQLAVISDFGHHPTAIAGTLRSLRARFPGRRLAACFEARSNTACRRFHEDAFADALGTADRVHLGEVFRAERYADDDRINLARMASRIGEAATAHGTNAALVEAVRAEITARPVPTVYCFFSNGSFDGAIGETVRVAESSCIKKPPPGGAA